MPDELAAAIVVDFPLRGQGWVAVNSPADRIPSHGTDLLGQRYAFDLLRVDDRKGLHDHPAGWLRRVTFGVATRECYAWGADVLAPFDAEVVAAVDGVAEPAWLHPVTGLARVLWNGLTFTPHRLPKVIGNHVILRAGEVFAALVHLAPGSVQVRAGDRLRRGDVVGRVGHTGNSTSPHLHFQLMDAADPLTARGLPAAFAAYEVLRNGGWVRVERGVPSVRDRLRSIEAPT